MTATARKASESGEESTTPTARQSWWPDIGRSGLQHFFEYQIYRFRKGWRGLVVTGLLSPILFLVVMGVGIGDMVDRNSNDLGGIAYLSYIGPGLLATTAMQWGTAQGLWPTVAELKWEGGYRAALVTPLTIDELLVSHIGWISLRFFTAAIMFSGVLTAFGVPDSWWFVLAPFAATLTCAAFAAPTVAFSSSRADDHLFPLVQRFVVIPLMLFSGSFFPVSNLPTAVAWFARLTPSWHGVELCRDLAQGTLSPTDLGHVGYCLAFVVVGWHLSRSGISKTLAS